MISSRACIKSSAWINGANRYYCGTHNHEMPHEQYQCALGQLEASICASVGTTLMQLDSRLSKLEAHFNDHLKTFAANLEKLHERDPTEPT